MTRFTSTPVIVIVALLAFSLVAHAQEASLTGTITDSTGGVLPGVTVTVTHEMTGNTFVGVTDDRGGYRIPARVGTYQLTAELSGFTTATLSGLELLVGQQPVVNLQMSPSSVQETVTVTGEAPLIDVTSSKMSGNVDPRQLSELPVNGRNWMDLTMLTPGSRVNAVSDAPVLTSAVGINRGGFQLNVDGQQLTNTIAQGASFGQPRFSRDAVAEFEVISSRFDATQGRSSGVQVNAITKSGTNRPSGTLSGYFRHSRFNAADFVAGRVLPYSNQQLSVTFGGPVRRDKVHLFGYYEYEREPRTQTFSSVFPQFNIDNQGVRKQPMGGARLDVQLSSENHLMVRGGKWNNRDPLSRGGGATTHPSSTSAAEFQSGELYTTLSQVLTSRVVNEFKVGYAHFSWNVLPIVKWTGSPVGRGGPNIVFRGYSIGSSGVGIQDLGQDVYSFHENLTTSLTKGGVHTLKLGGEYLYHRGRAFFCNFCTGQLDANLGPIPGNIQSLFPVWDDPTTWNLAPLSPITQRYRRGFGDFTMYTSRGTYAAWFQDDWVITPRLTLNLGLRYDLQTGAMAEKIKLSPFLSGNRPYEKDDLGPRLGATFKVNDRTVIRGGFGKYYADLLDQSSYWAEAFTQQVVVETLNDQRPDFAANPYNGPAPTYEQARQTLCDVSPVRGCTRRDINNFLASPNMQVPYSYQASTGVQRQLGNTMAIEADYVWTGGRHEVFSRNINLGYDPSTGANYPFTDISKRPYPNWGTVGMHISEGWSNYHGLQTAFTKRLSQRWQASATYTLSGYWDATPRPVSDFQVAPDLYAPYGLAATDQRHRAVFNGIWQLGYGLQLSGLYFFGSGQRFETSYGGDLRRCSGGCTRLRPDGSIVRRNGFVGKPIHRVDVRLLKRFRLAERLELSGMLEVFNLFNHANFGSYTADESSRSYGLPVANSNQAYQPRMLQLGFRFVF